MDVEARRDYWNSPEYADLPHEIPTRIEGFLTARSMQISRMTSDTQHVLADLKRFARIREMVKKIMKRFTNYWTEHKKIMDEFKNTRGFIISCNVFQI